MEKSRCRSVVGPKSCSRERTKDLIRSSSAATRRGVKPRPIRPRSWVCTGGSSITIVGAQPELADLVGVEGQALRGGEVLGPPDRVPDVGEPGQRPVRRRLLALRVVVHGVVLAQPRVRRVGVVLEAGVEGVVDRVRHPEDASGGRAIQCNQAPRRSMPSPISFSEPAKDIRTNWWPRRVSKSIPGAVATPVSSSSRWHQA